MPGSFPDSAPSDNADTELLPASEPAGKQLKTTRTSIPPETTASNAVAQTGAAGLPTNAATGKSASGQAKNDGGANKLPAGQELQQTQTDVPPKTADSNAAAVQAPGQKPMTSPVAQLDKSGGKASSAVASKREVAAAELQASNRSAPPDVQWSNQAATQAPSGANAGSSTSSAGTPLKSDSQAPKQATAESDKRQRKPEALDMRGAPH